LIKHVWRSTISEESGQAGVEYALTLLLISVPLVLALALVTPVVVDAINGIDLF
jgi:Flp pilus assembly pilin Flp